jgi:hypothetical protein
MAGCWHSINFDWILERRILLSLPEMDLQRQEGKLAEEQTWGLYSFDRWDLSAEGSMAGPFQGGLHGRSSPSSADVSH